MDEFSLHLSVMREGDACNLIKKGLIAKNFTDSDAKDLAKVLEYFPLSLQQAIAYINIKYDTKSMPGFIQKYLTKYGDKNLEFTLLHGDDIDVYQRTTLVTLNVTIDAMEKNQANGLNAIKILQLLSFIYADKIDSTIFLPLFENDSEQNREAFLMLEKYSIVTKIGKSSYYQIHRLVQEGVRQKFNDKEDDIFKQAFRLLFPKLYEFYFAKIGQKSS